MDTRGIDHVVVVVRDAETARLGYLRVFGEAAVGPVEEAEAYRRCIVDVGSHRLEICQPLPTDNPAESQASRAFTRTLETRGEGLHSIAVQVPDVVAAAAELGEAEVPILESALSRSFFVHPRALGGLIVQFLEADGAARLPEEGFSPRPGVPPALLTPRGEPEKINPES